MHVLAAPDTTDPRPGGFVCTMPGELLYRPFVCDSGREGNCGCERSMAGMTTAKGTTIAAVVDRDITPADYLTTYAAFLVDHWSWEPDAAREEAQTLADLAAEFPAGTLITIALHDGAHVFDELEV